ncbi:hypothetical protein ACQ4PT_009456 [Festuca glaucescens]
MGHPRQHPTCVHGGGRRRRLRRAHGAAARLHPHRVPAACFRIPPPPPPHAQLLPLRLAADPSGILLLQANLRCTPTRETIDRPYTKSVSWKLDNRRYFVHNATTSSAFQLPDPAATIMHQALLGLVVSPGGGGHYMVAELQPIIGMDTATLLCFSSEVGEWVEKHVHYPLPPRPWSSSPSSAWIRPRSSASLPRLGSGSEKHVHYPLPPRPWAAICVLSHLGRLWWVEVDLSWGLITCDPFADEPVLGFIPFPAERVLKCWEGWGVADKYRYVGVSGAKLRFVDMYARSGCGCAPNVAVWTLADPESKEWTLEHEARFTQIWADESYQATGLANKIPVLALIHPRNPDVVYFFLEEHLFGVDVRARKVVECEVYGLVAPPSCRMASRFVRAWAGTLLR